MSISVMRAAVPSCAQALGLKWFLGHGFWLFWMVLEVGLGMVLDCFCFWVVLHGFEFWGFGVALVAFWAVLGWVGWFGFGWLVTVNYWLGRDRVFQEPGYLAGVFGHLFIFLVFFAVLLSLMALHLSTGNCPPLKHQLPEASAFCYISLLWALRFALKFSQQSFT